MNAMYIAGSTRPTTCVTSFLIMLAGRSFLTPSHSQPSPPGVGAAVHQALPGDEYWWPHNILQLVWIASILCPEFLQWSVWAVDPPGNTVPWWLLQQWHQLETRKNKHNIKIPSAFVTPQLLLLWGMSSWLLRHCGWFGLGCVPSVFSIFSAAALPQHRRDCLV